MPSRLELQGDFNSEKGRTLKLTFEKCDRNVLGEYCHTEEEIAEWLQRKFIVILENQARFLNEDYEDTSFNGPFMKESRLKWAGIYSNPLLRQELVNKIKRTDLVLQDSRAIHLN